MNGAWRSRVHGERFAVPVEMRFIDLFMAALGALIFMSMLLAFLLRFVPRNGHTDHRPPGDPASPAALEIVTRDLPPARLGEPYELAFAYRGGTGPVAWRITAGAQEIPQGMKLDPGSGRLAGTPTEKKVARFLLEASDPRDGRHQRPFELLVLEPPGKGSRRLEQVLSGILTFLALLVWLGSLAGAFELKKNIAVLESASARGQTSVTWEKGKHEEETVYLPGGIAVYQARLLGARRFRLVMSFVFPLVLVWFLWRIWGAG